MDFCFEFSYTFEFRLNLELFGFSSLNFPSPPCQSSKNVLYNSNFSGELGLKRETLKAQISRSIRMVIYRKEINRRAKKLIQLDIGQFYHLFHLFYAQ
jgi:hypothetical protein